MIKKVNLVEKFGLIKNYWEPKIVGEVNDSYVKLVKFKDEFIWHRHEDEDELFFVVKGVVIIKLRDQDIELEENEFVIVPKATEHKPIARGVAHVMLFEPKTTLNTGDKETEITQRTLERI